MFYLCYNDNGDVMKKHELLIPVGDMECLKQAIANGADAVYGGCKNFGARKFAKNFTNEEIAAAIKLCHLYGVRFYATMNTLVKDAEVPHFLGQVEFLYKQGVDAIIMQDFGMISYVLKRYPNLEVHASTQLNNSSYDIVKLLYNMGVKRVVLSRELSLQQIENISVPIEKEVFVHGALCVSYSGCCLMSSMLGGRSGNRGECAGCCRLPYRLYFNQQLLSDKKYLLSTKELNTSYYFRELLDSDIYSFKVEGRMKSPEYVGFITRMYRQLIDSYADTSMLDLETEKLKTIFNREFTCGHLFQCDVSDMMNILSPNHIGLPIGKVEKYNSDKIGIRLTKALHQGDGIRFLESGKGLIVNYLYDSNGQLISNANPGDLCYIDNKISLAEVNNVSKTLDYLLMQDLKKIPSKKIPITFFAKAHVGSRFSVEISDGVHKFQQEGSFVQKSITAPVDDARIRTQLEKLGDTPFISQSTVVEVDRNAFLPLKEINEIRRDLVQKLFTARTMPSYDPVVHSVEFEKLDLKKEIGKAVFVFTEEQLETCLKLDMVRIYTSDLKLFKKYQVYHNVYYSMPRCLSYVENELQNRSLVKDLCEFSLYDTLVGDYSLNVCNIYTAYYLYRLGLSKITLSVELSNSEILDFVNRFKQSFGCMPNIEVVFYGQIEVMVIKGNILNIKENLYHYYLQDLKERRFPVYYNGRQTIVLNYRPHFALDLNSLKDIATVRYQFFSETMEDVKNVIKNTQ